MVLAELNLMHTKGFEELRFPPLSQQIYRYRP